MPKPAFYVARKNTEDINDKIQILNEQLYLSKKQIVDTELVDWFHTVGIGVLYIGMSDDPECPVECAALDPRTAFVVYSRLPGNEPIMGVNIVVTATDNSVGEAIFDVYTKDKYFKVFGSVTGEIITGQPIITTAVNVIEEKPNYLGEIPIIEYQYENNRMGSFESVIPLLDAINITQSNRLDGVEQFIQSLMILYNCQLGEDENGDPITPNYIRQKGAIAVHSTGTDNARVEIISEQLNQSETQVLVDYMYQQVLTICGMPSTTKGGSSTSDTGAAVLYRDGWYQADTYARNTEDLFKVANRYFDRIFVKILKLKNIVDISLAEFELQFSRNETANLVVKTQAAINLKQLGFSPELAFGKSGLSSDPSADVAISREYIDSVWNRNVEANVETVDVNKVDTIE